MKGERTTPENDVVVSVVHYKPWLRFTDIKTAIFDWHLYNSKFCQKKKL
jgi:hypothetical protein